MEGKNKLPNFRDAHPIDPLHPVSGLVHVRAGSETARNLRFEFLSGKPLGCSARIKLVKEPSSSSVALGEGLDMEEIRALLINTSAPYNVLKGDDQHWEPSLWFGATNEDLLMTPPGHVRLGIYRAPVESGAAASPSHNALLGEIAPPQYEYYLTLYCEVAPMLLEARNKFILESTAQTLADVVTHPLIGSLERALRRNALRLLYEAALLLGLEVAGPPMQDIESFFYQAADKYDVPLMVLPQNAILQLHNTVRLDVSRGVAIHVDGGIDLQQQQQDTRGYFTIMLGPAKGLIEIVVAHPERAAVALPVGVRRKHQHHQQQQREHGYANAYKFLAKRNTGNHVLYEDAYDAPTQQFLSECLELAGYSDEEIQSKSGHLIRRLAPVSVLVY